ncbi:MAG TPA: hypothetical protein VLL52_07950 [Anaerolineae bacterium]|nr:hypothetical protein [Anaerolineae bacterium]
MNNVEMANDVAARDVFVGREEGLAALEGWRQGEGQRLLLTAEAGMGKSALLGAWVAQLQGMGDEVAVVFVSVGAAWGTDQVHGLWTKLATELMAVYDADRLSVDKFEYVGGRQVVERCWQMPLPDKRQLLLIIDGVDELIGELEAGWLGAAWPAGVKCVVAVRGEGEEGRRVAEGLGWEAEETTFVGLGALTAGETGEMLAGLLAGTTAEAALNEDVQAELYRLSGGTPLLVELYAWVLRQKAGAGELISAGVVNRFGAGYDGFHEWWWADKEERWQNHGFEFWRQVDSFLALCAIGLGPLSCEDMLALAPDRWVSSREVKRVAGVLAPLVVEAGRLGAGYGWSQSMLKRHFREGLAWRERAAWEARFLAYGRAVLEELQVGKREPAYVSPYLLRYYRAHLAGSGADVAEFVPLVSHVWWEAWSQYEEGGAGFGSDLAGVLRRIEAADGEGAGKRPFAYLTPQVQARLYQAVISQPPVVDKQAIYLHFLSYVAPYEPDSVWAVMPQLSTEQQMVLLAMLAPSQPLSVCLYGLQQLPEKKKAILKLACTHLPSSGQLVVQCYLWSLVTLEDKDLETLLAHPDEIDREGVVKVALEHPESGDYLGALVELLRPVEFVWLFPAIVGLIDEAEQDGLLATIMPHLEADIVVEMGEVSDEMLRARLLAAYAPYGPEGVFMAAAMLTEEAALLRVWAALAPYLAAEVYTHVTQLTNLSERYHALMAILPQLTPQWQMQAFRQLFYIYTIITLVSTQADEAEMPLMSIGGVEDFGEMMAEHVPEVLFLFALSLTDILPAWHLSGAHFVEACTAFLNSFAPVMNIPAGMMRQLYDEYLTAPSFVADLLAAASAYWPDELRFMGHSRVEGALLLFPAEPLLRVMMVADEEEGPRGLVQRGLVEWPQFDEDVWRLLLACVRAEDYEAVWGWLFPLSAEEGELWPVYGLSKQQQIELFLHYAPLVGEEEVVAVWQELLSHVIIGTEEVFYAQFLAQLSQQPVEQQATLIPLLVGEMAMGPLLAGFYALAEVSEEATVEMALPVIDLWLHYAPETVEALWKQILTVEDSQLWGQVTNWLAPYWAERLWPVVKEKVVARRVTMTALLDVLLCLPEEMKGGAWLEVWEMINGGVLVGFDMDECWLELAALEGVAVGERYEIWCAVLRWLVGRPPAEGVMVLGQLLPFVARLAGSSGVAAVRAAVSELYG